MITRRINTGLRLRFRSRSRLLFPKTDRPRLRRKMKTTLLCLLISLSWGSTLVDSLALPPSDIKVAPKDTPGSIAAKTPDIQSEVTNLAIRPSQHNVDLSKVKTSEEAKTETLEKTASPWDSRQLIFNDYVNLKWLDWTGSIPKDAVLIYNQFSSRDDYVCSVQSCATGFYSPSNGNYCFYTESGKEYRSSSFKLLVNEDNFEVIQWQAGSYGSVPIDSIGRCPGVYVGKSQYGLGKVIPSSKVLSLPFGGYEYTYDYYEVLSLYTNYYSQAIRNVVYTTNRVSYSSQVTKVLATSKVVNNVCQRINRLVTLSKATINEQKWDIGRPTKNDATSMITTPVPSFSGSQITLLSEEDFEWKEGIPHIKAQTLTRSLQITVEPNHECVVELKGRTIYATMPFSAQLSRTYKNGQLRSTTIQGTFSNEQTDEISIALKQCSRIPNSAPCPP